jgi:hypothetical protein
MDFTQTKNFNLKKKERLSAQEGQKEQIKHHFFYSKYFLE